MTKPLGPAQLAKQIAAGQNPPQCPDWLDPIAKETWAHILAQPHSITEVDSAIFAAYCATFSKWRVTELLCRSEDCDKQTMDAFLKLGGLLEKYGKRLGLDPAARAAQRAPIPNQGKDALGKFLEGDE